MNLMLYDGLDWSDKNEQQSQAHLANR